MSRLQESQNVEWKEAWHDEYLKWVCGFANAQGGTLYIGVNDKGEVVGVEGAKRLLEDIPNKIQSTLGLVVPVDVLTEEDKDYLRITVEPSTWPVNYRGEYHYRSGSTRQQLKGLALTEFLLKKSNVHWEDEPVDGVSVDDLDKESFDIFRREALRKERMPPEDLAVSDEQLLESLELLTEDGRLTRAAIMLFHRNPEKWVFGTEVKIGLFEGADLRYQEEVGGSLILQADRVADWIFLKYLKAWVSYDGDVRVETYPYSRQAIREAVYNALMHSDRLQQTPIQIWIGEDTIYISNSLEMISDWTAEKLLAHHRSRPTNPHIARTFYRAGYVENWGRGIRTMVEECKRHGNKPPELTVGDGDFTVKFPELEFIPGRDDYVGGIGEKGSFVDDKRSTKESTKRVVLTDGERKLIGLLADNPTITRDEIASRLDVAPGTVAIRIKRLQDKGLVLREGGRRYGRWVVTLGVDDE